MNLFKRFGDLRPLTKENEKLRTDIADLRGQVREICIAMRREDKSIPTPSEIRDHVARQYDEIVDLKRMLRDCRRFLPSHGTWAEDNLDRVDWLIGRG